MADVVIAASAVVVANTLAWRVEPRARPLTTVGLALGSLLGALISPWLVWAGLSESVNWAQIAVGAACGPVIFVSLWWTMTAAGVLIPSRRLFVLRDHRGTACLFVSAPSRRPNRTDREAPDAWLVDSFAAHPQRQGLGTDLREGLTAWADYYQLALVLQAATPDVRLFYERGGFKLRDPGRRVMVRRPRDLSP